MQFGYAVAEIEVENRVCWQVLDNFKLGIPP